MKFHKIVRGSFNGQSTAVKNTQPQTLLKKWTSFGLVLTLLFVNGLAASAIPNASDDNWVISATEGMPRTEEPLPSFGSVTGVVQEIHPPFQNRFHVIIETTKIEAGEGEPSQIWFTITENTLFFDDARPAVGDTVTGFYDRYAPTLMIYPPQYTTVAMVVNPGDTNYFVGFFDENLVDVDNRLMLVIVEETKVLSHDGTPYQGSLKNQVLAVAYGATTRSIPAQTRPEKVILLPPKPDFFGPVEGTEEGICEGAEASSQFGRPFTWESWMPSIDTAEIVVEMNILTHAPAPITNTDGVIMVPLKHIAEALGFNVMWSPELRVVMLSDSFTVTPGQDAYVDMSKDEPLSIGTAPVIHNGRTFVPLHFFRDVIPMNNVYYFENQIVIDNQEKMH